jgi:hypothetical protein
VPVRRTFPDAGAHLAGVRDLRVAPGHIGGSIKRDLHALGTEKGLRALALFLENSGAFTKTGQPRATEPLLAEEDVDGSEEGDGGYGGDREETEDGDG